MQRNKRQILYTVIPHQKSKRRLAAIEETFSFYKNWRCRYIVQICDIRSRKFCFVKEHSDSKNKTLESSDIE